MKLINFEKKEENSEKTLNKKKVALTISVIIIICIMIVLSSIYITNIAFRNFIDTNIFKKNITENNATVIQIEKEKNPYFYAFDKYVVKLEENTLTRLTASGKEDTKLSDILKNKICISSMERKNLFEILKKNIENFKNLTKNSKSKDILEIKQKLDLYITSIEQDKNIASSTAVSPPPITATSLSLKNAPSQVAQYETPLPVSSFSPGHPISV